MYICWLDKQIHNGKTSNSQKHGRATWCSVAFDKLHLGVLDIMALSKTHLLRQTYLITVYEYEI